MTEQDIIAGIKELIKEAMMEVLVEFFGKDELLDFCGGESIGVTETDFDVYQPPMET